MTATLTKKLVYLVCSVCKQKTLHEVVVDNNGEFVAECKKEGCFRFLKFPAHYKFSEGERKL